MIISGLYEFLTFVKVSYINLNDLIGGSTDAALLI